MKKTPLAKLGDRDFTLCFIQKDGLRPINEPKKIIGFSVSVHYGKKYKPTFCLSSCTDDWIQVENNFFDSYEQLFLVAEIFYKIRAKSWKGCHPKNGEKLYSLNQTKIRRLHQKMVKRVDFHRRGPSDTKYYKGIAYYAGATV